MRTWGLDLSVLSKEETEPVIDGRPSGYENNRRDWLLHSEVPQKGTCLSDGVHETASPQRVPGQEKLMFIGIYCSSLPHVSPPISRAPDITFQL